MAVFGHPRTHAMATADHYRTLQLRLGAARELVEEAYWALIADLKASAVHEPDYSRRMAELNAAYEAIVAAPAEQRPVVRLERGLFRWRPRVVPRARSYYELLQIDEAASPAVVRVAARHAERAAPRGRDGVAAREALLAACRVLSDPAERAGYDARAGVRPGARAGAPAPIPATAEGVTPPAPGPDVDRATATAADANARAVAKDARPRFGAIGRRAGESVVADAEAERLLSLRAEPEVVDEPAPDAHPDEPAPELPVPKRPGIAYESGPRSGAYVPIPDGADEPDGIDVVLRATDDAEETLLRVVPRGQTHLLVHLRGPAPLVGDREMTVPVLVLEDGDTITVGESRAHFIAPRPR